MDLDEIVLARGSHTHPDRGMCVMEAVSVLAGEPFSDRPTCVSPVIAEFLRAWNDTLDDDDRQRLKTFIPLVVGTNAGPEMDERLAWMALDWLVRVHAPAWLRVAEMVDHADRLNGLPEITRECRDALAVLLALQKQLTEAWQWAHMQDHWNAVRLSAWTSVGAGGATAARDVARHASWSAAESTTARVASLAALDAAELAAIGIAQERDGSVGRTREAIRTGLRPTVEALQTETDRLLDRMIETAKGMA